MSNEEKQPFTHEMNGGFVTKGLAEYVKMKIREQLKEQKSKLEIDHLEMAKSMWKKLVQMYAEEDGMREGNLEFVTLPVITSKFVPESEIRYVTKTGLVLGKIVGAER
jgi:hypothetical protein